MTYQAFRLEGASEMLVGRVKASFPGWTLDEEMSLGRRVKFD